MDQKYDLGGGREGYRSGATVYMRLSDGLVKMAELPLPAEKIYFDGWSSAKSDGDYPYTYYRYHNLNDRSEEYLVFFVDNEIEIWKGSKYGDYFSPPKANALLVSTSDPNKKALAGLGIPEGFLQAGLLEAEEFKHGSTKVAKKVHRNRK